MVDDVLAEAKAEMVKALDVLTRDLGRMRTGRANLAVLDGVKVDYYGTATPLSQVASLSTPEPRLIVVKPWEKTMVPVIHKAIQSADLGLNPSSDGELVRIPIPPLTEERRKDLVKMAKKVGEDFRVQVRRIRRDANEMLKQLQKDKDISEDDEHKGMDRVQKLTDEFISKVDEIVKAKEKDIFEI
ncbi:MAG: ribosome recycling factor [Deltaproteobacteria bacterium]|nr:ribosome recycling factor [Deltaproteobacteria bacterium]